MASSSSPSSTTRPVNVYNIHECIPTGGQNQQQPYYITSSYPRRNGRESQYYISGVSPDPQKNPSAYSEVLREQSHDTRYLTAPSTGPGLYRSQASSSTSVSSSSSVQRPQRYPEDPEHRGAMRHWVSGGANEPGYWSYTRDDVTVVNGRKLSAGQASTYRFDEGFGTGEDHTQRCQHLSRFSDNRGLCFCPRS